MGLDLPGQVTDSVVRLGHWNVIRHWLPDARALQRSVRHCIGNSASSTKAGTVVSHASRQRRLRRRRASNLRITSSYESTNSDSMDANVSSDGFKT